MGFGRVQYDEWLEREKKRGFPMSSKELEDIKLWNIIRHYELEGMKLHGWGVRDQSEYLKYPREFRCSLVRPYKEP